MKHLIELLGSTVIIALLYAPLLVWLAAFLATYKYWNSRGRKALLWSLLTVYPLLSLASLIYSFFFVGTLENWGPPL